MSSRNAYTRESNVLRQFGVILQRKKYSLSTANNDVKQTFDNKNIIENNQSILRLCDAIGFVQNVNGHGGFIRVRLWTAGKATIVALRAKRVKIRKITFASKRSNDAFNDVNNCTTY